MLKTTARCRIDPLFDVLWTREPQNPSSGGPPPESAAPCPSRLCRSFNPSDYGAMHFARVNPDFFGLPPGPASEGASQSDRRPSR